MYSLQRAPFNDVGRTADPYLFGRLEDDANAQRQVVDAGGAFRGVIFQLHLIARQAAAPQRRRPLAPAPDRALARDIMDATPVTAAPATPVAALLVPLAISGTDAVPILDAGRLVGIVTQTDLIAALARHVPEGR